MTNPDNVGGPMWTSDPIEALRRIEDMGGPSSYIARECLRRSELCRAAPAGGECKECGSRNAEECGFYGCGAMGRGPIKILASDYFSEESLEGLGLGADWTIALVPVDGFKRKDSAPAGGDDVETLLALVPRPAMAHHKMDEAEEREIKRVNRFRDRVIENIRAHCAYRPGSAPAGSGDVSRMDAVYNFLMGIADLDGVSFGELHPDKRGRFWWRHELAAAYALLRKLQQGAE